MIHTQQTLIEKVSNWMQKEGLPTDKDFVTKFIQEASGTDEWKVIKDMIEE